MSQFVVERFEGLKDVSDSVWAVAICWTSRRFEKPSGQLVGVPRLIRKGGRGVLEEFPESRERWRWRLEARG